MFCKYCGKELKDSSKFCSKCGKQLAGASVEKVLENQKIEVIENNQQNETSQIVAKNFPTPNEANGIKPSFEEPIKFESTDTVKNQNNFNSRSDQNLGALAKSNKTVSALIALLIVEFIFCCIQIYRTSEASNALKYYKNEAAQAQYDADSKSNSTWYGDNSGRLAKANEMWTYVDYAESDVTTNGLLLTFCGVIFVCTLYGFSKTVKKAKKEILSSNIGENSKE